MLPYKVGESSCFNRCPFALFVAVMHSCSFRPVMIHNAPLLATWAFVVLLQKFSYVTHCPLDKICVSELHVGGFVVSSLPFPPSPLPSVFPPVPPCVPSLLFPPSPVPPVFPPVPPCVPSLPFPPSPLPPVWLLLLSESGMLVGSFITAITQLERSNGLPSSPVIFVTDIQVVICALHAFIAI